MKDATSPGTTIAARLILGLTLAAQAFTAGAQSTQTAQETPSPVVVRYLVNDVAASVSFYTNHLGFTVENNGAPVLASVRKGLLNLVLVGPTATGAKPAADGTKQVPGGWNRILLPVADLEAETERLKKAGVIFRTDIQEGVAARQILLNDPSGNTVELVQFKKK
jgi:catechol 2,3-dioxygenase-like lactoylglutathione lyase family enzyme